MYSSRKYPYPPLPSTEGNGNSEWRGGGGGGQKEAISEGWAGFYLGFIAAERSLEWPDHKLSREVRGHAPRNFFEMNTRLDAIWCILRRLRR